VTEEFYQAAENAAKKANKQIATYATEELAKILGIPIDSAIVKRGGARKGAGKKTKKQGKEKSNE
jgi:hypothetical protein